ncbi:flagellar FlbD family protein [Clostridium oryzae]|uniref:Flagellar protein FlbD n=1 Tax=Clostridium oryzae TaxID=1450648 RepID=A0A1V4ITY0_9CLOT|nr:flagellar FlbD family protein [Clostridium oryzae]OPJ63270.1 flagellar protein FlbD [Clostridium oryzae]
MIRLTGFDGKEFILNADNIEKIEEVPECIITLTNGKKYMILEKTEEVVQKVIEYKNKIYTFKFEGEDTKPSE